MNKNEIQRAIKISILISIIYFMILLFLKREIKTFKGIKQLMVLFSIIPTFWSFYFKYGWKIKILKLLIPRQNLNGSWFGTYESKNIKTNQKFNGEIALNITQNFFSINIISMTTKYTSNSYSAKLEN